jgi:hypothetical protein
MAERQQPHRQVSVEEVYDAAEECFPPLEPAEGEDGTTT